MSIDLASEYTSLGPGYLILPPTNKYMLNYETLTALSNCSDIMLFACSFSM